MTGFVLFVVSLRTFLSSERRREILCAMNIRVRKMSGYRFFVSQKKQKTRFSATSSHIRHFNVEARGINSKNSQVGFGRATTETGETRFGKRISGRCGIVRICGLKNEADIPWQVTFAKHMPAFSQNDTAFEGTCPRRHYADFTLCIDIPPDSLPIIP
jgi:hypothetical protein